MNVFKDKVLLEEAAVIKSISAVFVEKDWYAVQVLKKVREFSYPGFDIIFSGGTALSKAHRIIQRFSEDVDFRVQTNLLDGKGKSQQRKILSDFKYSLISHLRTEFDIDDDKFIQEDDNRAKSIAGLITKEKFDIVLKILKNDKKYPAEYDHFVKGMSYAVGSLPEYHAVIAVFEQLSTHILG